MAMKILCNNQPTVITDFGSCSYFNTTGTFSKSDGIISINITSAASDGTSNWRGFYFTVGNGRRMNYSLECRYVPTTGTASASITHFAWEQASPLSITITSEWKKLAGTFVRAQQQGTTALTFYSYATTFPLGTYYFRNINLERMPWIFTVNGKPLTINT